MLVLCSHFFGCFLLFTHAHIDHAEQSLGSAPTPPAWCEMPSGFVGLPLQANQWRRQVETVQMWRAEESVHLYPERSPNPQAHSSSQDFQLWDGISPRYHKSTPRSRTHHDVWDRMLPNHKQHFLLLSQKYWLVLVRGPCVKGALHWFYTSRPGYSSRGVWPTLV